MKQILTYFLSTMMSLAFVALLGLIARIYWLAFGLGWGLL
jgi:hypothetical protein